MNRKGVLVCCEIIKTFHLINNLKRLIVESSGFRQGSVLPRCLHETFMREDPKSVKS